MILIATVEKKYDGAQEGNRLAKARALRLAIDQEQFKWMRGETGVIPLVCGSEAEPLAHRTRLAP